MGGEVPSSYYLSNNGPVAKDYMETMSIGAGGRKKMKYKIDVPFSILRCTLLFSIAISLFNLNEPISNRWEFMTEGGDIKFRVYYKNSKGIINEFVSLSRVDSHLGMEEGQVMCEEIGKCKFKSSLYFHIHVKLHCTNLVSIRCF